MFLGKLFYYYFIIIIMHMHITEEFLPVCLARKWDAKEHADVSIFVQVQNQQT